MTLDKIQKQIDAIVNQHNYYDLDIMLEEKLYSDEIGEKLVYLLRLKLEEQIRLFKEQNPPNVLLFSRFALKGASNGA